MVFTFIFQLPVGVSSISELLMDKKPADRDCYYNHQNHNDGAPPVSSQFNQLRISTTSTTPSASDRYLKDSPRSLTYRYDGSAEGDDRRRLSAAPVPVKVSSYYCNNNTERVTATDLPSSLPKGMTNDERDNQSSPGVGNGNNNSSSVPRMVMFSGSATTAAATSPSSSTAVTSSRGSSSSSHAPDYTAHSRKGGGRVGLNNLGNTVSRTSSFSHSSIHPILPF